MPEDRELAIRAAAGDGDAFGMLVTQNQQRIYNLAYRMMGNADDARDACQDAFVIAYRRLDSFRGESAFSTWLYRVAVNACYDALRSRARAPQPSELHEQEALGPDPSERATAVIDVQRALTQVPEEFRSVLVLHDMQDLAYEDISVALDIPIGTVKSRLHRGRAAMGRLLAGTESAARTSEGA